MIREREIADPNSCLNRAVPGEPVFVLRANDENAPGIVAEWAEQYRREKGGVTLMTQAQYKKYTEALELATAMREWKKVRA